MRREYIMHDDERVGDYKYTPDTFINCMILEIVIYCDNIRVDVETVFEGAIAGEDPLTIERVSSPFA